MEHAQRAKESYITEYKDCLNPYFNGTCSKSVNGSTTLLLAVLILILMEHAQRGNV